MQKKAKQLFEEDLQIAVKRREAESKGGKERYTHLSAELHQQHTLNNVNMNALQKKN